MDTSPWLIRHPADRYPAIVYCGGPWQRLGVYCCLVQQYFNIVSHSSESSASRCTAATCFQVSMVFLLKWSTFLLCSTVLLSVQTDVFACRYITREKGKSLDNLWVIIHHTLTIIFSEFPSGLLVLLENCCLPCWYWEMDNHFSSISSLCIFYFVQEFCISVDQFFFNLVFIIQKTAIFARNAAWILKPWREKMPFAAIMCC